MSTQEFEQHFKNLEIKFPKGLEWAKSIIVLEKYKPFGVSKQYPYMPVFTKPIELSVMQDKTVYRVVPLYPTLMVSKIGNVRRVSDGVYINPRTNLNEYKVINFYNGKKNFILTAHRLVAMAWVSNNDYVNNNIVDHIDNNKFNNVANNLRWTSQSLNASRVRNIVDHRWWAKKIGSDMIHKFTSLSRLANFLNTDSKAYSANRCPFVVRTPLGNYIIEDVLNFKGWSLETEYHTDGKKVLWYIDNIGYTSIIGVIETYGLDRRLKPYRDKVLAMLKKQGYKVIPNYTESKQGNCIEVTNTRTNETMKFSRRSDGYKAIGASKNAFNERLSGKREGELINGYLVKWCGADTDTVDNSRATSIRLCKDDEVILLDSLRKAALLLNVDRKTLVRNKEINGYKITIE